MSGPVTPADADADGPPAAERPDRCIVEVIDGRDTEVGAFRVNRVLPRRARRTVGAWCFVDHMGPGPVTSSSGLDIGPHPHIGLQTVTWLLRGEVLHRDSLGSEQLIRPGQLNLMTAGHGISHAEETRGVYEGELHGVQLWVAQPGNTRHGPPAFEHHAELPTFQLDHADATVIVGEVAGHRSEARRDTDHLGVDVVLRPGASVLPVDAAHEHAVTVLEGEATVCGEPLRPGRLAYLGTGRDELPMGADTAARVLVLGGSPFPDALTMWWNYVARTHDEVTDAHRSWLADDGRFGSVRSPLDRVVVDGPPWGG